MQSNKLLFFSSEKICLTVEVTNIGDILALANNGCIESNTMTFSFNNKPTEFDTDNCATHHICHLLHFSIELKELGNVWVKWIAGSAIAAGIGAIRFAIKDSENNTHTITLHNVVYLPEASKKINFNNTIVQGQTRWLWCLHQECILHFSLGQRFKTEKDRSLAYLLYSTNAS